MVAFSNRETGTTFAENALTQKRLIKTPELA